MIGSESWKQMHRGVSLTGNETKHHSREDTAMRKSLLDQLRSYRSLPAMTMLASLPSSAPCSTSCPRRSN